MTIRAPFRLRKLAWCISAALAATGTAAAAPAGRVDFAVGGVTVTGADGRSRPAAKGLELQSGDRVVTGSGRAQIRFTDGAYVSLQPNSDFSIREYQYEGKTDGTEKGVFGLLRGALRTVTGAIGRVNRGAYQIQTPTATIGIRGTGGLIQILPDGATLVTGNSGVWSLTNRAGSVDVPAGKAAKAGPNQAVPPVEAVEGPMVPPAGPLDAPLSPTKCDVVSALPTSAPSSEPCFSPGAGTVLVAGNNVTEPSGRPASLSAGSGLPPLLPPILNCSTGCEVAFASLDPTATVKSVPAASSAVVLGSDQSMVAFNDSGQTKAAVGVQSEFGTSLGVTSWGRWTMATIDGSPWPNFNTLAYVTGLPTPIADITGMSGTFTFNLIGATAPTDGSNIGTVTGGQVIGRFGPSPTVDIRNFTLAIAGNSYDMTQNGIPVPTAGPNALFSSPVSVTPIGGGACISTCSAQVNGQFMGAGATHAGFAYNLDDTGITGTTQIVGAAAFKR
jgi:hypothetical protein